MNERHPEYPTRKIFYERWSARAMSGQPITDQELMSLFEAARWAPSSYNNQPWRFIYAKRDTPDWKIFFDMIVPANQVWAQYAAVLILVISHNNFSYNNKPSRTHSFDTGAATENLALQGFSQGLVVHGMEGFDYDRAQKELGIPSDYTIEAMFAVGKPGDGDNLPEELQKRETLSDRNPVESFVFEGRFKNT